jgi:hypothetical protein
MKNVSVPLHTRESSNEHSIFMLCGKIMHKNEKAKFVALVRYVNTHPFYSVGEFLLSKNSSYGELFEASE